METLAVIPGNRKKLFIPRESIEMSFGNVAPSVSLKSMWLGSASSKDLTQWYLWSIHATD